jgi:hypothetical protein
MLYGKLNGDSSGDLKNQNVVDRNADGNSKGHSDEVSDENEDSIRNWNEGHTSSLVARKSSRNVELKGDLMEKILRQQGIQAVTWVIWLILAKFTVRIRNKKEQRVKICLFCKLSRKGACIKFQ